MRLWSWIAATLVALTLIAGLSWANGIPFKPPPAPPTQVTLNVAIDENIKEPTLLVPKKVLANLRADVGDPNQDPRVQAMPLLRTVLAGAAIAGALALGGLWLVRSRRKPGSTVMVALIAVVGVVAISSVVWANL